MWNVVESVEVFDEVRFGILYDGFGVAATVAVIVVAVRRWRRSCWW